MRRAVIVAVSLLVLTLAVIFTINTWQKIWGSNSTPTVSTNTMVTLKEEAVGSVSAPPPVTKQQSVTGFTTYSPVDSTTFAQLIDEGRIDYLVLNSGNNVVAGYKDGDREREVTITQMLPEQAESLKNRVAAEGIKLEVVDPVRAWNALVEITPPKKETNNIAIASVVGVAIFFIIALVVIVLRRKRRNAERAFGMQAAVSGSGKGGRDFESVSVPPTRFTDVAGCDEAVEDLEEIVDYLKNPSKYARVKAEVPRGALLIGPPGTGKTLLARAVAGEAGVPFYPVSGSDFVEKYVGVGASRVRKLFSKARKHKQGAIIFIDEIDAVGRRRNSSRDSHQEQESTLNALLVEMDGFHQDKVIVLAASNRADILDPALRRPGRLERQVQVPLPDRQGRERILKVHAANRPLSPDIDLQHVARRTSGMSGAELARVVNESCLAAARRDCNSVSRSDFEEGIEIVALGKARRSAVVTERDRLITAWHEAGHTVAALKVPGASPPISVSIIPRGMAGGVTWMHQGDDMFLSRPQAYAQLIVAMSGRAAEEILLNGEFTSGPHGDLAAATSLATNMVTKFGMTTAGLMVHQDDFLSAGGAVAAHAVKEIESLLADSLTSARKVLRENMQLMERIVEALLDKETLSATDLSALLG